MIAILLVGVMTIISFNCMTKATCHLGTVTECNSLVDRLDPQQMGMSTNCLVFLPEASSLVGRVVTS